MTVAGESWAPAYAGVREGYEESGQGTLVDISSMHADAGNVGRLADLDAVERRRILNTLSAPQRRALLEAWPLWAHDGQAPPPGAWAVWTLIAGRGFGKTRAGAEWVHAAARADGEMRIALVGATLAEVRRVMIEGESGLLATAAAGEPAAWSPSVGRIVFASGAQAYAYSGGNPEALRGPQHHLAWCDELAKWGRAEAAWRNLRLGLRLGDDPRILVTTTPRPIPLLRSIMDAGDTVVTGGSTERNLNLPPAYVGMMRAEYGGTRLGRQELDGELMTDVEDTLWPRALIERCRVPAGAVPDFTRVVIGVDPPAGSGPKSDACGIVAVGLGPRDRETGLPLGYVLEDASVARARPDVWGAAVVAAYRRWNASRVIAEKNQGGDMVESVLRAVDAGLPLTLVHASKGKTARAEPVAALYEQGRVFHAGAFPKLEDEMAGMVMGGGGGDGGGGGGSDRSSRSPDRADALVWALTELMLGKKREPRVLLL